MGLKLDKLVQYANDGCTNGIAIGPAISDLISELVLSAVDTSFSREIEGKELDFIGARFKDDYRFLCQSKEDADCIIKILQRQMSLYNLSLNESKTNFYSVPDGLFRPWTLEYIPFSLKKYDEVTYKQFEDSLRGVLKIDETFEGVGVIDKFLSELVNDQNVLKLNFRDGDMVKAVSLLLLLKERRAKAFPQILGIFESIVASDNCSPAIREKIISVVKDILDKKIEDQESEQYDLIWVIYFIKSLNLFEITFPQTPGSQLILSLVNNKCEIFKMMDSGISLFNDVGSSQKSILKHLELFKRTD